MEVKKIAIIGSIVAGVSYAAYRLAKLSTFGKNVKVANDIKVLSPKLSLTGISFTMRITPTISNPTNAKVKLTQPYVELTLAEGSTDLIGYSSPTSKVFTIPALGVMKFDPIVIPVNIGITQVKSMFEILTSTKSIGVFVNTKVFIQTATAKIPVVQKDKKEIKF